MQPLTILTFNKASPYCVIFVRKQLNKGFGFVSAAEAIYNNLKNLLIGKKDVCKYSWY